MDILCISAFYPPVDSTPVICMGGVDFDPLRRVVDPEATIYGVSRRPRPGLHVARQL